MRVRRRKRDEGDEETERVLAALEKDIRREFAQAEKEVGEKLERHLRKFRTKDELKRKALAHGLITKDEYLRWRMGQIMTGKRWKALRDTLSATMTKADQVSRTMLFDVLPYVFAVNYDYATYLVESTAGVDTSYTLFSADALRELMIDSDYTFIPSPGRVLSGHIDVGEVKAWNGKQAQSAMVQALLQGESITGIADRVEKLGKSVILKDIKGWERMTAKQVADTLARKNRNAAIRNARTMITGVENAGRVASYKRVNDMGINTKKKWLATFDKRTRHWHAKLDGVAIGNGAAFENEFGKIMYPGDPAAHPSNIFNCRCTLTAKIEGFKRDTSWKKDADIEGISYDEWKAGHYDQRSDKITKQEEIAETMRRAYGSEYAAYRKLT